MVVEVADEEGRGFAIGRVGDAFLFELPHAGYFFAVELVEGGDGLAPLAGAEGEGEGLAAVDAGELGVGLAGSEHGVVEVLR